MLDILKTLEELLLIIGINLFCMATVWKLQGLRLHKNKFSHNLEVFKIFLGVFRSCHWRPLNMEC